MSDAAAEHAKLNAARAGADYVKDGMIVGLGTGSTAAHLVRELGRRVDQGLRFQGVPTSQATLALARASGLTMIDPDDAPRIDVTIDGADEADDQFRLIKGGGGALLREKIIAGASADYVIIADSSKHVRSLGQFPLPVEVTPFAAALTARRIAAALRAAGCADEARLRRTPQGALFVSDGGNVILDCHCQLIPDPEALEASLNRIPGIVEHGLFIAMARTLIIGGADGVEILRR
jgi:ribose 5-phosphate isomerase A